MTTTIQRIVTDGLCIGCGLCESICGPERVEMVWTPEGNLRPLVRQEPRPEQLRLVNAACPGLGTRGLEATIAGPGAKADAEWGRWQAAWRGWAGDPDIRFRAATGGVLTALACFLIESGEVDFVVHVRSPGDRPIRNVDHASRSRADVLAGMASRYAPAPPLRRLMQHLDAGRPFAVVAKPCDVSAVRALGRVDPRVGRLVKYLLSISCGGESNLHLTWGLMDRLGLAEEELAVMRYRGHGCPGPMHLVRRDGAVFEATYNSVWGDLRNWNLQFRCKMCMDPIGEEADVVALDIWPGGSPTGEDEGFNGIVARTARGRDLAERAAAAGALVLDRPMTIDQIRDTQPHQTSKKMGMVGRLIALRLSGRLAPCYPGLRVWRMAARGGLMRTWRNLAGTMRRIREGRTAEPPPRDALASGGEPAGA